MATIEKRIGDFITSSEGGVFYIEPKEDGETIHVCSPLEITARTKDMQGNNWGLLCEFSDPEGTIKRHHFPNADLMGGGQSVVADLVRKGLALSGHKRCRVLLVQYLQTVRPTKTILSKNTMGWAGETYVTPVDSFGPQEVVYSGQCRDHGFDRAGNWKSKVGKLCAGNSRLVFAASAAFAAPMLDMMGIEGGGFHYRGESSRGKSTALDVAASVWGDPSKYVQNFDSTKGALEVVAENHNDGLLVIDELGMVDGAEIGNIVYLLSNGQGKGRMGQAKRRFRVMALTSGEVSLAEQMATAGKAIKKGQEVRLLDIEADAGAGLGLFEDLHRHRTAKDFADHLKSATRANYGTASDAWLKVLTGRRLEVKARAEDLISGFTRQVPPNVDGVVFRAIRRFAVVAAAGEIASAEGITGWSNGESIEAARKCFATWLEHRATFDPKVVAIQKVRDYIIEHEELFQEPGKEPVPFPAGVKKGNSFLVFREHFRDVVCAGKDHETVAHALEESGFLNTSGDNRLQQQVRLNGQQVWVFSIKDSIKKAA